MPGDNEIKSELDLSPPSEELLEFARKEINEDPETRCQVISDLRDMIYGEFVRLKFVLVSLFIWSVQREEL